MLSATPQSVPERGFELPGLGGGEPRIIVKERLERLEPPKLDPKHKWMFEWLSSGFGRPTAEDPNFRLKVRVWEQQHKEDDTPATSVARMAMRLWDFNFKRLDLDHKDMYDSGRVHFYLAFGGPEGAEQLFTEDEEAGTPKRVNAIYLYQVQKLKDPLEFAREVAHEYGHATLPPVGGFKEPEDWGNGYLGEKLYLRHLRDEIKAKRMTPADAMGAPLERLDAFVKREADPLAKTVGLFGPDMSKLGGSGPPALNAYLGLALYAADILPPRAFARSLVVGGSVSARDYAAAVVLSASEVESLTLRVPEYLKDKDIWIPLGKGRLASGGGVLKKSGDWAHVRPLADVLRVVNPPID